MPSLLSADKFRCYTDLEKAVVVLSVILSVLSSLFSVYKFRMIVRERSQKLRAAGIRPTFKRVVFVERALANQSRLELLSAVERAGSAEERRPGSEGGDASIGREVQRQRRYQCLLLQGQQQQLQAHTYW